MYCLGTQHCVTKETNKWYILNDTFDEKSDHIQQNKYSPTLSIVTTYKLCQSCFNRMDKLLLRVINMNETIMDENDGISCDSMWQHYAQIQYNGFVFQLLNEHKTIPYFQRIIDTKPEKYGLFVVEMPNNISYCLNITPYKNNKDVNKNIYYTVKLYQNDDDLMLEPSATSNANTETFYNGRINFSNLYNIGNTVHERELTIVITVYYKKISMIKLRQFNMVLQFIPQDEVYNVRIAVDNTVVEQSSGTQSCSTMQTCTNSNIVNQTLNDTDMSDDDIYNGNDDYVEVSNFMTNTDTNTNQPQYPLQLHDEFEIWRH